MVRTFTFNPSIQSSEFVPGVGNQSNQSNQRYNAAGSLPIHVPLRTPPHVRHRRRMTPEDFSRYYKEDMDASINPRSRSLDPITKKRIFEDETTVFGIRSVVIDGQRFYQPLELNGAFNEQRLDLKPTSNHETSRTRRNVHKDQMATALMAFSGDPPDPEIHKHGHGHGHKESSYLKKFSEEFNSKLRATQHEEMIENDSLPWARGNPQPKSGKRGTLEWSYGQRYNPFGNNHYSSPIYNTDKNGWLNDSLQFSSTRPANLYQTTNQEAYSSYYPPVPISYPPLNSSFGSEPLTNYINQYSYGITPEENKRYEKEQHRLDLLRQIEDNNRRKMLEKHREWVEDQREIWRSERTLQRQREEVEKEQREIIDRQIAAETKAQRATELPRGRRETNHRHRRESPRRRRESPTPSEIAPRLEWWEKKAAWQDRQVSSPVIPALRGQRNSTEIPSRRSRADSSSDHSVSRFSRRSASSEHHHFETERPISLPSRQSRSQSRNSRRSYQPSLIGRAGSNASGLRQLSATKHRLEDEYQKVKAAVEKNQYDPNVFD